MSIISTDLFVVFALIMVAIAFLYASVGHGGGSGYLALMALFSFPIEFIKPTALILNIFVAGVSFWFFKKSQYFNWKLFYPFALTSIPAAFLGGYLHLNPRFYKYVLGIFLVVAVLRMLGVFGGERLIKHLINLPSALAIGFGIGLFSGLIGIGGGIILSPVIILLGWGNMKETAAVAALFILVNSISGLGGFLIKHETLPIDAFYLVPIALSGGIFGALYGSNKFSNRTLTYILSIVLLMASFKLFVI